MIDCEEALRQGILLRMVQDIRACGNHVSEFISKNCSCSFTGAWHASWYSVIESAALKIVLRLGSIPGRVITKMKNGTCRLSTFVPDINKWIQGKTSRVLLPLGLPTVHSGPQAIARSAPNILCDPQGLLEQKVTALTTFISKEPAWPTPQSKWRCVKLDTFCSFYTRTHTNLDLLSCAIEKSV